MRILVLEPFGARAVARGSHAALIDGWQAYSQHSMHVLALPGLHWKWRSRHAAVTFAQQAKQLEQAGERFDVVFCSEMLNLAEWRGLAPVSYARLPTVVYFHENQLTYPLPPGQQRDYHLAYNNILSALSADEVWFNSHYHLGEFVTAADSYLQRMPDFQHRGLLKEKLASARVMPPGIDVPDADANDAKHAQPNGQGDKANASASAPLRIGWVARWEHDKRPDKFVEVIRQLDARQVPFELILLGQQFESSAKQLEALRSIAGGRILHEGHATSREEYWDRLGQMDIVVSTADHEFFGIAVLEAMAAGVVPMLPARLAYPELLKACTHNPTDYLYQDLAELIERCACYASSKEKLRELRESLHVSEFCWAKLSPQYDRQLETLLHELLE